ncbi:MAG: hypothetical protein ABI334_01350 [Candidatus Dormiibacterota bacterium]
MDQIQNLIVTLTRLLDWLYPFAHPKEVVLALLNDSFGLLLKVWGGFILRTTDFDTGGDFINNATIHRFEPAVQLAANAALVVVAMWASYRIMWGHGLRSQYTVRVLLPRLLMGVVLINFSQPMFQSVVVINNTLCDWVQTFVRLDDLSTFRAGFADDPGAGAWEIITTAVLAAGYDVLAVTYFVRYAILIVLAITAPIAGLMFTLPETHHISKQWMSYFTTNLLMQPMQLFVLAIGFALERGGASPVHHLFALASLLLVFKVPGALGGAEKAAHKLQSTVDMALHHIEHAMVKA